MILTTAAGLLIAVTVWFGRSSDTGLPRAVALTELGYHLNGYRYSKGLPDQTDAQKQRRKQLETVVQARPDDVHARLEYGYLLLEMGEPTDDLAEAGRQFQAVLDREPTNPDALHGLAVVLFRQDRPEAALQQFRAAVAGRAENPVFRLNTAICLERLGHGREATSHFDAALRQTRDSQMQTRIREYLQLRGKPAT